MSSPTFDVGGVLDANADLRNSYPIIRDYFTAWKSVCEHTGEGMEPWESETERWELMVGKKGGKGQAPFLTLEVPFEAVLNLFPLAYEIASKRSSPSRPTSIDFVEVLKPLGPLDWSEVKILNQLWPDKKYCPADLYTFFSWALEDYATNGILHEPEEVWNPDHRDSSMSKPGRGFFSPPNPEHIRVFSNTLQGGEWPSSGRISLWSPLIPNARRVVEWQIKVDGEAWPGIRKVVLNDGSSLEIPVSPEIIKAKEIQIDCIWTNWNGSGSKGITLRKTENGLIQPFEEVEEGILAEAFGEVADDGEEEVDFIIAIDHGEGPIKTPPAPNKTRVASSATFAPTAFRRSWCQGCFHGNECRLQWCPVRDKGVARR